MTDLGRLTVSLTKHNAHKVATLLRTYDAEEILNRLGEVRADGAQARKNLSIRTGDIVPAVWSEARKLGPGAIDALVLVGIVFSHHDLIRAISAANQRKSARGRVDRNANLSGKAYTNFVRIVDQLGYASRIDSKGVTVDLATMLEIPDLGPLVADLLRLKLKAAGWTQANSLPVEAVSHNFHGVFGVSPEVMAHWLERSADSAVSPAFTTKDGEFFRDLGEGLARPSFSFRPGHTERQTGPITKAGTPRSKADRLHNEIQNKLYKHLVAILGASNVGTEMPTGSGTTVDLATRKADLVTFYEIKTTSSVRANIRQALPQLLEYAYWPDQSRADRLIVVSHVEATPASIRYIAFLSERFGIPIRYQQFDLTKEVLV